MPGVNTSGIGVVPVAAITAAVELGTLLVGLFLGRKGPQQKRAASEIANESESYLKRNLELWEATAKGPGEQQQALNNFDQIWADAVAQWNQLGEPGQRAIQERSVGGIVPGTGGNWFTWYRDPIATYQPSAGVGPGNGSGVVGDGSSLLLPLGIGLVAVGLLLSKGH